MNTRFKKNAILNINLPTVYKPQTKLITISNVGLCRTKIPETELGNAY